MLYTALKRIKSHSPCRDGWEKLLRHLDKTEPDDEPLSLAAILESNGICDALWALHCIEGFDREIILLACDFVEQVLPIFEKNHPNDNRPRRAIEVSRQYANGEATNEELDAACAAACAAQWAAPWADAWAAAWAAGGCTRDAVIDSARADSWDAAWDAGGYAMVEWQAQHFRSWLDTVDNLQEMKNEKG